MSANTVARLKSRWLDEYGDWRRRDLSQKRYVYLWADGVYSQVRMDDKLCLLVILGVTEHGRKELVAVEDGYRESEASWRDVLTDLRTRKSRNCGSRDTTLAMVFRLLQSAERRWKRIKGFKLLELVVNNVQFRNGEQVDDQPQQRAA